VHGTGRSCTKSGVLQCGRPGGPRWGKSDKAAVADHTPRVSWASGIYLNPEVYNCWAGTKSYLRLLFSDWNMPCELQTRHRVLASAIFYNSIARVAHAFASYSFSNLQPKNHGSEDHDHSLNILQSPLFPLPSVLKRSDFPHEVWQFS
jgi:hypothetical protein